MFRTEAECNQTQSVNLAIIIDFLIGLKASQGIDRIVAPRAVRIAFEIAAIRESFLNRLITFGIGMKLVRGSGRRMSRASLFP